MTPALLSRIGEALYGERFQVALATALGVNDRTMRRWVAGDSAIPDSIVSDLIRLCRQHEARLRELTGELVAYRSQVS